MAAPCDWELDPGVCCEGWDEFEPPVRQRAIAIASRLMWAATGRRYGRCETVVQPCGPRKAPPLYRAYPVELGRTSGSGAGLYPYLQDGQWVNAGLGCSCCAGACEIELPGPTSTTGIVSVTAAGEVVPPASYIVFNGSILTRTDGACWPSCVNYGNQDPPDFEITYLRGLAVPEAVLAVTGELACEFAQACVGGPCRLPGRLRRLTRQGVEVETAEIDRTASRLLTGIDSVDQVIQGENPFGLVARPRVYNPDRPAPRRVT